MNLREISVTGFPSTPSTRLTALIGPDAGMPRRPSPSTGAPELVLLIGLPASGKTTFFRARFARTHEHVSKDLLRHRRGATRRQRETIEASLPRGVSVVIDDTNATAAARARWLALGRAHGARLVGYYLEAPVQACLSRNRERPASARVPDVAIRVIAAKLEPPSLAEGFDDLRRVRLLPGGEFAEDSMRPGLPEAEAPPDPA